MKTNTQDVRKVRVEPKRTVAIILRIMRILRRTLIILVMIVLKMRP
jgi:hypothetical protein